MIGKKLSIDIGRKDWVIGTALILLGISAPIFINVENFRIYEFLFKSLQNKDKGFLILGSIRLVVLNSLRGLPHYLGAFMIAESINIKFNGKNLPHIRGLVTLIIIPVVYSLINTIHKVKYDLGVPAFTVILFIIFLEKQDYFKISFLKKAIIIILLLLGVQWLDVVPQLDIFKFGRGETSKDIKAIACIIDGTHVLGVAATMFFLLFTFSSILVTKLVADEHKILVAKERNERVERELNKARMEALQARHYIELKNLVHDLKTPLTSIQALTSVIKLMEEDPKIQIYLQKIESSIDKLSEMISEILYEEKMNIISTEELFNYIFSHISHLPFATNIEYENNAKTECLKVNKIRFSRAIINALDNSYTALRHDDGKIWILVNDKIDEIEIEVRDNGIGIKEEFLKEVKKRGFSKRQSTGLGLSFIESVVNSHQGRLDLNSKYQVGTSLKVILPKVKGES